MSYSLPEGVSPVYYSFPLAAIRLIPKWVYTFHMPLFFMLSGAVFALKPSDSTVDVMKSKAKRLLIPYFVYGWGFLFPVKWLGDFYTSDTVITAMRRFIYGGESGHLWFLAALFWVFTMFLLMDNFIPDIGRKRLYLMLLISFIISRLYVYVPGKYILIEIKQGMQYLLWFSAGYVFESERKRFTSWNTGSIIAIFLALCVIELLSLKYSFPAKRYIVIITCSLLTYLLSVICSRSFPKAPQFFIGNVVIRNLFYVYLFHDPLEYIVLKIFMNGNYLTSGTGCILYVLSRTAIIFMVCVILGEAIRFIKRRIKCQLIFS